MGSITNILLLKKATQTFGDLENNMETEFEYSAFISYKREDEKWAVWLQNHLEHYSIPAAIRKEIPRLPKRIKPVFRDKTDLGAGGLVVSLHKELERSHFLIVICSPKSACSDWVGQEIEYFRSLCREEQVIPFVVEGIPHCEDSTKECFHPVFEQFSDEPLGINVKEIGKNQALVKVLAKILDIRFDVLWGRISRCSAAAIYLSYLLISRVISTMKASKFNRKAMFKESIEMMVVFTAAIAWLVFAICWIADEGWIIFSNPL